MAGLLVRTRHKDADGDDHRGVLPRLVSRLLTSVISVYDGGNDAPMSGHIYFCPPTENGGKSNGFDVVI